MAILAAVAPLAGCGGGASAPTTPRSSQRHIDPLLALTVAEPLMSDQQLSYQSNLDAVRPPDMPLSAPIPAIDVVPAGPIAAAPPLPDPASGACEACRVSQTALTLGALAERLDDPAAAACAPALRYSASWATRLPADLPLPASARVIEAAGGDGPACHLRAVAYGAALPVATLLASEHDRLTRAGFGVTYHVDADLHALTARRERDGARVTLLARDHNGMADVRLVMTAIR